jgi:GntR family transcriptional repressor for pyruvate dehydrogenase complex
MIGSKENQELIILKELAASSQALGSSLLCDVLRKHGEEVSVATVGRLLRDLDYRGITKRVGYQGRVITPQGRERLEWLIAEKKRNHYGLELLKCLRLEAKQDLIDILVARRAIESEIARLAALHASEKEIRQMQRTLQQQRAQLAQGHTAAGSDVEFHSQLARAGKNRILQAAMDLIRQEGQLSPIFEFIRKRVKSAMVDDHERILQAVVRRDPEGAGQAMIDHVEGIIRDVEKYWKDEKFSSNRE